MEINKITFENYRNIGISQTFEELDVNGDGVINNKDKAEATEEIKNTIANLLSAADNDSELIIDSSLQKTGSSKASKTGAGKNKYGLTEIDSSNVQDEILNSKGTVYVVIGALSRCGRCNTYEKNVQSKFAEISKYANVVSLDCDTQSAVRKEIMNGFKISGSTLPFIIKFVDGKPVEQIPYTSKADAMAETLISKAEKGSAAATDNTTPATTDGTNTATTGGTSTENKEDTTATAAATPVKLSDGTDISASTIEELKTKLETLNKEIEDLSAQIEEIQNANDKLLAQKAELEKEEAKVEEEVKNATENLKKEEEQLEVYTKEYEKYQEEILQLNKEILTEQERESEEFKLEMDAAVKDIIKNYNPEKDGDDFETYFAQQMDTVGFPTFTKLKLLNWKSDNLSEEAQNALQNIMTQSNVVKNAQATLSTATASLNEIKTHLTTTNENLATNNTKIEGLNADLSVKQKDKTTISDQITALEAAKKTEETDGTGLKASEILALVSDAEKNFAKEKGVNLENCLIMQGADNNWHIYIMDPPKNGYYQSVARYYLGCTKESYALVPSGSGKIPKNSYKEVEGDRNSGGRPAYKISGVNECWTDAREVEERSCCYQTCSPLSFDVDGDGINTTNETVSFDIDGDGELDTVNNSAEWVLAFDKDHDGIAGEDGFELFGDNTDIDGDGTADGYKDGFEALKALAQKEGLIGENDNKLDENDIELLSKKYGLTMTNGYGGEAKSLTELGITEINLSETSETKLTQNFDGRNNDIMTQEGATFVVNGETREYADIWNAKKSEDEAVLADEKEIANTNIENTVLALNKDGVIALKGEVNFKAIKDKVQNNANIPDEIFDEIVEFKEEEDEEKKEIKE